MSMIMWAACPACARHVRLDESSCPFCQAELPASFRQQKPLGAAARRLNRAALYALRMGAASATAVATAACSGETSAPGPPYGGVFITEDGGDASSVDGQIVDSSGDGQEDAPYAVALYGGFGGIDAAYGGFIAGDAGSPDGDASSSDGPDVP